KTGYEPVIVMSLFQVAGGNVTYQNTMSAAITVRSGPEGSITRDSVYNQDVQAYLKFFPVTKISFPCLDSSYGFYYVDADYPVTKTLRDPVVVEVHIMNRTDPNLVLTLGDCWVTSGPSASMLTWGSALPKCPYTGDNYLTSLVTVDSTSGVAYPSHYKRFEMFALVDPVAQRVMAEKVGFLALYRFCIMAAFEALVVMFHVSLGLQSAVKQNQSSCKRTEKEL
uniref:ZP domain-containing protein n=1 Tax=Erpetoichthys calabaricus TaxID=27687 RepID=A0A8C4SX76_ERPCA